jgi:hypothetical protein
MHKNVIGVLGALVLGACAGRDPMPIATSQPQDNYASCGQIQAEIMANNSKVTQLAEEQGWKTAQNVTAGVVGIVIWPVWFAMDFKGAADKDVAALQARQQYLAILATERCAQRAAPGAPARQPAAAKQPAARQAAVQPPPPDKLPPDAYYQPPPPKAAPPPTPDFGGAQ